MQVLGAQAGFIGSSAAPESAAITLHSRSKREELGKTHKGARCTLMPSICLRHGLLTSLPQRQRHDCNSNRVNLSGCSSHGISMTVALGPRASSAPVCI